MLLTEIVAPRTQVEPGKFEYVPDFQASAALAPVGVKMISVRPQHEELELLGKYGITPDQPLRFPVVYAYTLIKNPADSGDAEHVTGLMHALKKRHQDHIMSDDNLKKVFTTAVDRIISSDPKYLTFYGDKKRDGIARQGYNQLRNILVIGQSSKGKKTKDALVIIPLASSSPVVKMLADVVASVTGATVIPDMMSKVDWPKQSSHVWSKEKGFVTRKNGTNPEVQKEQLEAKRIQLQQKLEELNNADFDTDAEYKNAMSAIDKTQKMLNKINDRLRRTFQIKNAGGQGQGDDTRGFYGFQSANADLAQQIEGKRVLFIDDNVVSSATLADAAKSLYRVGAIPSQILGLVTHRYKDKDK